MVAAAYCVGFVLIGALQAFYGPAIPAPREDFGLSPSIAGLALSAHFVCGVAGVLLFDRLYGRIGNRRIPAASYLLMATGGPGRQRCRPPPALGARPRRGTRNPPQPLHPHSTPALSPGPRRDRTCPP